MSVSSPIVWVFVCLLDFFFFFFFFILNGSLHSNSSSCVDCEYHFILKIVEKKRESCDPLLHKTLTRTDLLIKP